jgi:hypothetical protein
MRNADLEGPLYHENLKKAILWLAKISTPPDPRFKSLRHLPPIGNTWLFETSCLFGYMAKAYRDRDPDFANTMRWMWEQQGRPMHPGIGGSYPTTAGYREVLVDIEPAQRPPKWGSELFPGSGAILRSGFPGNRETQLYLVQGPLHEHYDHDQGSFELWGKGRPLCLDFGYNGSAPAWQHNRVDIGNLLETFSEGEIVSFDNQSWSDYIHSRLSTWNRQVIFVKDKDPLGPNYFVMRDSLALMMLRSGKWWLWLNTEVDPLLDGTTVRVTGKQDVDLDVWFEPSAEPQLTAQKIEGQRIRTKPLSIKTHSAGPPTTDQRGLSVDLSAGRSMIWVMYRRLRDQKPPSFQVLADGRCVKIESTFGTDYVFLSRKPFTYLESNLKFRGTAGVIQIRRNKVRLILNAGKLIGFADETLTNQGTSREFPFPDL